ncbi:hypothetical protein L0Y65_05890 [Candidatus Micrarchaeota archaeon]|nr:hypothetical protein [Candidatus Micrarchaeota archaeon]
MRLKRSHVHSVGDVSPAKAKPLSLIGGALVCAALSGGVTSGYVSGLSPWTEQIIDRLADTLTYRSARRRGEEELRTFANALSIAMETKANMLEAEAAYLSAEKEMTDLRNDEEHYSNLRGLYRSGWIDPKNRALDRQASRLAIWQKILFGENGYRASTLGLAFGYIRTLDPSCENHQGRSVNGIISSGRASSEEKARVLASFILAAGGEAYLSADCSFLYALAKKRATLDDIREIDGHFRKLAAAYGIRDGDIHGRLFGEDYYIYCDPARQISPGLGTPPEGPLPLQHLETLDY